MNLPGSPEDKERGSPPRRTITPNTDAPSSSPRSAEGAVRTLDSATLLGPSGVLYIRHANEVYRLQNTRFGKLILTK